MNKQHVDIIVQYALTVASLEDEYHARWLGPIHLLKYVYLADMVHAENNEGKTFTEASWQFYHFGPFSQSVHEQIALATKEVHAKTKTHQYKEFEETIRYSLSEEAVVPDQLIKELERKMPFVVARKVKQWVHQFGNATAELLHYVYCTVPMLRAAPSEKLDFTPQKKNIAEPSKNEPSSKSELTAKQQKLWKQAREEKKKSFKKKLEERIQAKKQNAGKMTPPRYDEVFEEGQRFLDQLAGEPLTEHSGQFTFSDELWKSPPRSVLDDLE